MNLTNRFILIVLCIFFRHIDFFSCVQYIQSVRSIIRRAMMEADLASWTPFLLGVARYGIRFLNELHSMGEIAWWISDSSLVNAVLSHASLPIDSRDSASIEMVRTVLLTVQIFLSFFADFFCVSSSGHVLFYVRLSVFIILRYGAVYLVMSFVSIVWMD